ncbi:MAG TPA: hypothetical protein VFP55_13695, partial [Solirubrobacteraceae bacterium]|nr:hypothetical protein [Solirubrobacteraceae bacterium]
MTRIMFDSINVDAIPSDATAVAGYVGGHWPTFHQLGRFKHANRLSIAVTAAEDAACLDCEPGDVPPAAVGEIADWLRRQRGRGEARPVIYASRDNLPGIITGLHDAHGIAREKYRVWSAHYGVGAHICSGVSCGAAFTADATQWTDKALGRNLDESLLSDTFFPESPRHHRRLPALHKPRV